MSNSLHAFAKRVEADDFFLAVALADYARSEQITEQELAAAMECSIETLTLLRLCRRPRTEPALFREDIQTIAERFAVNAQVLAEIVRRSEVLTRLRHTTSEGSGLLMAARDRHDEPQAAGAKGEAE